MRYFTFLVVCGLLLGFSAQAQDGRRTAPLRLQWEGYHQVPGSDYTLRKVPAFTEAQYRPGSLFGHYILHVPGTIAEGELRNTIYEPFSTADAALFRNPSSSLVTTLAVTEATERGQTISVVTVPAVRRNAQSGQYEKLISASYSYTLGASTANRGQQISYASTSVLSTGNWYKIGVPKSGIFKLDYDALRLLGLDVQNVDPRRIQIFGNATGLLPQPISTPRPDDLVENAVYFSGDNGPTFENGEFFLFYAPGPHVWERVPNAQRFRHIQNIYSDTAYYFVTVAASPRMGRRVVPAPVVGAANAPAISQFVEREFYEKEQVNLAKSGRVWLGETFLPGTPQSFSLNKMTDLVPGTPVQVTVSLASSSPQARSFQVSANSTSLGTQSIAGSSRFDFPDYANSSVQTYVTTVTASTLRVGLTYNSTDISDKGYLDYLEVNAIKPLQLAGSAIEFRSFANIQSGRISPFTITNGSGAFVWDVTNPRRARSYSVNATGSFVAPTDSLREFVAFTPTAAFDKPTNFGKIANQNLHASLNSSLELVIVTHPLFLRQAERLASHRRTHDNLQVAVVTTEQVYNEFSSGGQDITAIRDMMKMVYDRRSAPNRHQYLLLFGDASYNYKAGGIRAQNFVPTYESRESFVQIGGRQTFCSDDYYGLLDDDEGEWLEDIGVNELMDIGVGRLPIRVNSQSTTAQAELVVNKLIRYDSKSAMGSWRNRLTFVADDGDGSTHISAQSEPLVNRVTRDYPAFNIRKVYLDLYSQVNGTSGEKSPDAERAFDESFEQGSLIICYNGHGGPDGLTQEQILNHTSVLRLQNANKLGLSGYRNL